MRRRVPLVADRFVFKDDRGEEDICPAGVSTSMCLASSACARAAVFVHVRDV